ncbi:BTAD domain-containing putative transcriptional regulator [Catellatospora sp. NPDC049133]|uniref:AfsR/SARP family transcriptional regulator n=1 Tax=Catellatospora sp. NPDC049133 TaxID=3155499 RepID=UPI0033EF2B98
MAVFGILGPVSVTAPSGTVPIARPRNRAVLGFLLLHAGRLQSTEQIVDALWGGAVPSTAPAQVYAAISALRAGLRPAGLDTCLVSRAPGYLIELAPGQLDRDLFSAGVAAARTAVDSADLPGAARHAREALKLWRGPALADITAAYAEPARSHLDEQQALAYELLADVELALGRHTDLVPELLIWTAAHPIRERLVSRLMLALYRAGRQADALGAARDLRRLLRDEHGLDPGPEVTDLEAAILRRDPALDPSPPSTVAVAATPAGHVVPAQLPAPVPGFAGRALDLAHLDHLLDASGPRSVVVSGTAGVGKTALAVHWAHGVTGRFPDGQLFLNLRGFDPRQPALPAEVAVRELLQGLSVPARELPDSHDAQVGLYRSLMAGRRMLVVLDNAADAEQVRPLLPASAGSLALITSRNRLSGLAVTDGAATIALGLLDADEARQLLANRIGPARIADAPGAADDIVERCAHLPLALSIAAARAAEDPRTPLGTVAAQLRASGDGLAPFTGEDAASDIRSVLSWSYRALSEPAARLLRRLGLHPGPDIGDDAAAALVGVPAEQVRPLLRELDRASLVAVPHPGRYTLHDLLRAFAVELAERHDGPDRTPALRRLLDFYLHSAVAAAVLVDPAREAVALDRPADGVTARTFTERDTAVAWLHAEHHAVLAAVRLAHAEGFDTHTWQLSWSLVSYLNWQGHHYDWREAQDLALAAAYRLGDRVVQARTHRGVGRGLNAAGRADEAMAHYHDALRIYRELGDVVGQGAIHLNIGALHDRQREHEAALEHSWLALDLYRRAGYELGQARALNNIGWAYTQLGEHRLAIEPCQEAIAVCQSLGDVNSEADAWDSLGHALHHSGLVAEAIDGFQRALAIYRTVGNRGLEAVILIHLGQAHRTAGDPDAAERAFEQAAAIHDDLGATAAEQVRALSTPRPA